MSTLSTRLFLGFLAGFLSHLIFQGGLGGILYAAHLVPALPWSLMLLCRPSAAETLSLASGTGSVEVYALL